MAPPCPPPAKQYAYGDSEPGGGRAWGEGAGGEEGGFAQKNVAGEGAKVQVT